MQWRLAILTLVLLGFTASAGAQRITLSGRVVDRESGEPLGFASVGIKGKSIGTITNNLGEFDFHLPEGYGQELFVVSMLGYKPYEVPVWSLVGQNPFTVLLDRQTVVLQEIVVKDSLLGGDILSIALGRMKENYPSQPYLLDGFYRDLKKIGGTYVSLLEAAVKIYDENYDPPRNKNKLRERVALQEVRRSLGYGSKFTTYFDEDNLLENLLLDNDVRYRNFPTEEIFFKSLVRKPDTFFEGKEIFVITIQQGYRLTLFVDKQSFAIMRLEYENNLTQEVGKKRGLQSRFERVKREIEFKEYAGRWYLHFIRSDQKLNWYSVTTGELRFETELHQLLLVNQIEAEATERIGTTRKMRSYGLQYQDMPYNKEFWDNYNVLKETPLDQKIRRDLEKAGPLDRQFENR